MGILARVVGVVVLLMAAGAMVAAGGWAVVTVVDVPHHGVAGRPLVFDVLVRQHGFLLAADKPVAAGARLGTLNAAATVRPKGPGVYRVSLTLPTAGEWVLNLSSGLADASEIRLPVVGAGDHPPTPSSYDRGMRLFAAKGCVTCHRHDASAAGRSLDVGPVLTGRHYPEDVLAARLRTPPPCVSGKPCMPNLELGAAEISDLTAFLNRAPVVATRR